MMDTRDRMEEVGRNDAIRRFYSRWKSLLNDYITPEEFGCTS
jgi:hypothetical protein